MTRSGQRWYTLLAALGAACGGASAHPAAPAPGCDQSAAERQFGLQPSAAVILVLRDTDDLPAAQERVLRDLAGDFELGRRYGATPALAGNLTRAGFERAKTHDAVRCVQLDGSGRGE